MRLINAMLHDLIDARLSCTHLLNSSSERTGNICLLFRDISCPECEWAMKMGQWPMSYSFACKNQDFDEPFEILMGHLERMICPRNLNIHLTAKCTPDLNSLCMGPSQNEIRITLSRIVFS